MATFNPDRERFARVLDPLLAQGTSVVVVDDASTSPRVRPDQRAVHWIDLPANVGLAAALNVGARAAIGQGATHLLFLDQDSIVGSSLIDRLLIELGKTTSMAAVGPAWRDSKTGRHSSGSSEASFLITSGMLMRKEIFTELGGFDETLRMDSIDREWCFRALAAGYRLLRVDDVTLDHRIGDAPLFGAWVRHSPERLYAMMRNRVLLYRRGYVPWTWKLVDVLRAAGKLFMFSVFFPPRTENLRQMLRGLRDGLQMRRR